MMTSTLAAQISGLFIYPVKSLRGIALSSVELDPLGLVGDRRFMVVNLAGDFLTQRTHPKMAQITTALINRQLTLTADSYNSITVTALTEPTALLRSVNIWQHKSLLAEDCGHEIAQWLSDFLATNCRLVRIGPRFQRPLLKNAASPNDHFAFADGAPVLIISEASLHDLNHRIQATGGDIIPMNRFRPNIVLSGCKPFAEDSWNSICSASATLRNAGPSSRCLITTTDQTTGQRMGKEPLRALASFRRLDTLNKNTVFFGANYINTSKTGTLQIGDALSLLD